ncbi:hypothetical protein B7G68_03875 [Caulobacter segnis]|uniref:Uncharacterized protein n=2 Tax=Caulobacter segnis TaxID=88688 RepID=D5VI11_CAUST|nr:DUF5694 domain-containing protein [Caulobacter segnis]ADG09264.1 conserved hypothetical protein [Caulobacter segnis ATCC 21756]AVQ04307.1 hypothetical protein B7G68_03875 [Caulobacter segnis]
MIAGAAQAQDYRPTFHPDTLKGPPIGRANEVLVLGTPHLSGLPKTFDMALLAPLIDRLAAWKPTGIATEDLSGLQCDALRRYPARYAATVESYCYDPSNAGLAIGLDVPAANAEAERLLAAWPAQPTAAQRRRLAAVFIAAGERNSALVQWLRLPEAERRAGDSLNDEQAAFLETFKTRRNESTVIAAVLAARLGLERLWSVDDHSADAPDNSDPAGQKAFEAAIMKAWDNPVSHARRAQDQTLRANLDKPDGVLNLYRAYNAAEAQLMAYKGDFGAAFVEPSPEGFGRQYLGFWETRNLRMVGNIRDVLGQHPGMRMLAIVGASHKGYYEAYLNQMHDVRLISADAVLR